ncbi:protein of unknown function (DUF3987) [Haematococcus lacustris]|uniref:Uncharacterized protein n=1 Tax=Haematococcus lacustris TaxID=44745 RepID=A0A699YXC5_HAELA|nr:protein of unknown function (DUF3987) [Haematococcus lacustris]
MAGLPVLALAATVLGCAAFVSPNRHSIEKVNPCLWAVIAAPPGSGKTPAMSLVMKSLSLVQHGIAKGQEIAGVPELRRVSFLSGTGLLDELFHSTSRSHLLAADELATFVNNLGRYGSTPAAASGDHATMLSVASGARMVLGTKGGGRQVLEEGEVQFSDSP